MGWTRRTTLLVTAVFLSGCDRDEVTYFDGGAFWSAIATPSAVNIAVGDSAVITVSLAGDQSASVRWVSTRPAVAQLDTVVTTGRPAIVRALGAGQAVLNATLSRGAETPLTISVPTTVAPRP